MAGQLVAHDGEGLDQPRNILLRADVAGVEQKRIVDLVALQDSVPLALLGLRAGGAGVGGAAVPEELGSGRVVNQADAVGRNAQQF